MESWEALDVDDSDLPSLLRPCKRHHQAPSDQTTSASQPILTPSSHISHSQPTPETSTQTLDPYSQHFDSAPPPTTSFRRIPGPAGAVQAAMLRKAHDNRNLPCDEDPTPTQEYIRRAVEDAEEDEDFKHNPWLWATDFVSGDGVNVMDGVLPTSLSCIKKLLNTGKVDQVIAVIKSCTPNGLGDLTVTLKDPTGTIGGSIHRKVLTESEFAKDIYVGSVLILRKVAVFAPSRTARYLNITLNNVVKVFCKDNGPQLQNYPASTIKYAALGSDCSEKTRTFQKSSWEQQMTEAIMNGIRQNATNARGGSHIDNQKERGDLISGSSTKRNAYEGKEPLLARQGGAKEIFKEAVGMEIADDNQVALEENDKETQRIGGVEKQRQPLMLGASLPEWTDEQLNELFAMDCEDAGSLF